MAKTAMKTGGRTKTKSVRRLGEGRMPDKLAKASPPFPFILELLEPAAPVTRPMFGCTAVYVGERIVLILREKAGSPVDPDNGVWLATTPVHHESLARDFPSMRSITLFGPKRTGWQVLPASAPDFEESVERACRLVLRGDPRIGKVPKPKKRPRGSR